MTISNKVLYEVELTGAGMWSKVLGRGKTLRIEDLTGGANVGMLLYNADERHERYNMPDTLKGQQIFFVSNPYVCIPTWVVCFAQSRLTVVAGMTLSGIMDGKQVKEKFGEKTFQDAGNHHYQNARDCFLTELGKWGLGERDLVPNLNWFSKVTSNKEGVLEFIPGNSKAGDFIEIRMEMNALIILNTCAHPMNPIRKYQTHPVKLSVHQSAPTGPDDPCIKSCPENERAFRNTEDYHKLRF